VNGLKRAKGRDLERWLLPIEPSRDPFLLYTTGFGDQTWGQNHPCHEPRTTARQPQ